MLSEKEIEAIKNGAYGVSRKGLKCKYVGDVDQESNQYYFAYFNGLDKVTHIVVLDRNLEGLLNHTEDCDVVGLWVDKPEPFNLERALLGEPVMTRDGAQAYIQTHIIQPKELEHYSLVGFVCNGEQKEFLHCDEKGRVMADDDTGDDIVGMWKEPEPVSNTVTLTLPRPLNNPQDGMWYINDSGVFGSYYGKEMNKDIFDRRVYFGAKEDAQAWFDAMKNNRR